MKPMIVTGNWKMNTLPQQGASLAASLAGDARVADAIGRGVDVILCPPYTGIAGALAAIGDSGMKIGAQNCHHEPSGAYTGEISALMLEAIGCGAVIVGHSERRRDQHETNDVVARKLKAVLDAGMLPIACVGETLSEREAGIMADVITRQISALITGAGAAAIRSSIIAYEPVWAIGTGLAATPGQAQEVHDRIRTLLVSNGCDTAILYGGSVTSENAAELFACPDINGALVGGASLKADVFATIVAAAARECGGTA